MPKLCRLVAPVVQQPEQRVFLGAKLFQRMTIQAGDNSSDKPAREAHLNDRDQRAILFQDGGRPAEIVCLLHGVLHCS